MSEKAGTDAAGAGSSGKRLEQDVPATRIWPWLLGVTLPLYLLDQWSKFWVVDRFVPPWIEAPIDQKMIPVIEGTFNLVRVHNQGVAFGMGNGTEWAPLVFPFISLTAFVPTTFGLRQRLFVGQTGMPAAFFLLCWTVRNLTHRPSPGHLL